MKRMKHPDHGFHHAIDAAEEARMRLNGWVDEEDMIKEEKDDGHVKLITQPLENTMPPAKRPYNRKAK